MIISRDYVTFRTLLNTDPDAAKLIKSVFENSYGDYYRNEWIMSNLLDQCFYQRDMGWAMHEIGRLMEGLRELDKTKPYDNGYTYDDVNDVEVVWSDENSITLHLLHVFHDDSVKVTHIVKRQVIKD